MTNENTLYAYLRVSTSEQKEKDYSIPRQREGGEKIANAQQMNYVTFEDEGVSASSDTLDNRPKLVELLSLVKEGIAKYIYVFDITRLSRNDLTKALILNELKKHKVELYTFSKKYDFDKEEDVLTFKIFQAVESYESILRKVRFQIGYISGSKKGRYLKGIPPYSFKKDKDGYLIIDEEEAKVLLKIIDMYLEKGMGTNQIAKWLNENNIPTKTSKVFKNGYTLKAGKANRSVSTEKKTNSWNPGTINSIFKNPVIMGKRSFKIGKEGFEVVACPAIIDEETFNKIQLVRKNNAITKVKIDKYPYLLKGLLQCGCGNPMHGRVKPNRGESCYRCNSKRNCSTSCNSRGINIDRLNTVVWNAFRNSEFYHDLLSEQVTRNVDSEEVLRNRMVGLQKELVALENEIVKSDNRIKEIFLKGLDNRIPTHIYEESLNGEKANKEILNENIRLCKFNIQQTEQNIKDKSGANKVIQDELWTYYDAIRKFEKFYPFDTMEKCAQVREVLRSAIKKIAINYDPTKREHEIKIEFNWLGIKKSYLDDNPHKYYEIPLKTEVIKANNKVSPFGMVAVNAQTISEKKIRHVSLTPNQTIDENIEEMIELNPSVFSPQSKDGQMLIVDLKALLNNDKKNVPPIHTEQKTWRS